MDDYRPVLNSTTAAKLVLTCSRNNIYYSSISPQYTRKPRGLVRKRMIALCVILGSAMLGLGALVVVCCIVGGRAEQGLDAGLAGAETGTDHQRSAA